MEPIRWTTKKVLVQKEPFEIPARVRTRCGYQLFKVPDILRVNKKLYISKRYMDRMRKQIALSMQKRIDEMARAAFYSAFGSH